MTTITLPLDGKEPEHGPAWSGCVAPERWRCWTGQGAEVEVANLLVALVMALKPEVIVETGTHLGVTVNALAAGCRANGSGHVWSLEPDEGWIAAATHVLGSNGLVDYVTLVQGEDVVAMIEAHDLAGRIGLGYVDCGEPTRRRASVAQAVLDNVTAHGVVLVHDTSEAWDAWGDGLRGALSEMHWRGIVHLPTPRGLTILGRAW
jgi:predicted O-methyltransferase YrrM